MTDYYGRDYYTGDGSTSNFAVSFPYLLKAHVLVYLTTGDADPVLQVVDVDYSWTSPSLIHFTTHPGVDVEVLFRRNTPRADLIDRLTAPSTLNTEELNTISTQLLYLVQEALDSGLTFEGEELGFLVRSNLIDLRYTQDIAFVSTSLFELDDIIGPFVVTRTCYLPEDAIGSKARVLPGQTDAHVFQILRYPTTTGSPTIIGELTILTNGTYTWDVSGDATFTEGQSVALKTSVAGGITQAGVTLRLRRTDPATD